MYLRIHRCRHCALLAVLLGLMMDVTSGTLSIQLTPQYPVINGAVTLSIAGVTEEILAITWYKGPKTDADYQILAYHPGNPVQIFNGSQYNPRITAPSDRSLQIKDLQLTDRGNYTAKIQTDRSSGDIFVNLTVYEPVTKPKITAPNLQPKENQTFTLTCDSSHSTTITWTRRGPSISSGAKLSADNKTLTFASIKREDRGEYRCEAQNLVSKNSSDPYTVTVAYGPDKVHIEGPEFVRPDFPFTLSCSADSFPSPEYQWQVKDKVSEQKAQRYRVSNAVSEDEGLYTCVVKNPETLRQVNASIYVNVTAEYVPADGQTMGLAIIIGVTAASVLLLILIAAMIYLFIVYKRRKLSSDENSKMKTSSNNGQPDVPAQTVEQHELQYASIEFSKNSPNKEQKPEIIYENRNPQAAQPLDNVVYSELKLR